MLPLWLEAGYRVGPRLSVGAHAQVGFAQFSACPQGVSCSAQSLRAGLFANIHLPRTWAADPWFGVMAGVEGFGEQLEQERSVSLLYWGPELLGFQAGADYWVNERFTVGPFLAGTLGMFSRLDAWTERGTGREALRARGIHGWLMLGVRGVLPLFERESLPSGADDGPPAQSAPAVRDYDAALREERSLAYARRQGRTGLVRQKLQNLLRLTERALAWMETSDVSERPARYLSGEEGALTPEVLAGRLRALNEAARRELEALAPAESPPPLPQP